MSDGNTKPREFAFSFVREPHGFIVVWNMDKSGQSIYPIEDFKEICVIERSAYDALEAKCSQLESLVQVKIAMGLELADDIDALDEERDQWRAQAEALSDALEGYASEFHGEGRAEAALAKYREFKEK